jgi:hypothetical protein
MARLSLRKENAPVSPPRLREAIGARAETPVPRVAAAREQYRSYLRRAGRDLSL